MAGILMRGETSVPILMYHKVAPVDPRSTLPGHYVPPELFERHMAYLASRGFATIPIEVVSSSDYLPRSFVITFDDGYENFYTNALPVLKRYGFGATVFLVANQLGGINQWDSDKGDVEERLMTLDQILDAQTQGISFGSHTLDHADLTSLEPDEAWRQIAESRETLAAKLGREIPAFCYPYGRKNSVLRGMVWRAGYSVACTTEKGPNTASTDPFELRRINVRRDTSLAILRYKLWRDGR